MYFIQWLRGNQGALLWPFLLRLLTEPSSHGVQDHQLGMFFFPLALPFFHLLFTPSKEQKRHLSSLSLSFTVGKPFGIPTFIRSIRWLGKASYGHPRSVKVPVVPPSHHHKGTIGMSSSHHLCTAWLEKIQIFDGKWYRIFRHTWAMLAICELGGTYLILLK